RSRVFRSVRAWKQRFVAPSTRTMIARFWRIAPQVRLSSDDGMTYPLTVADFDATHNVMLKKSAPADLHLMTTGWDWTIGRQSRTTASTTGAFTPDQAHAGRVARQAGWGQAGRSGSRNSGNPILGGS